MPDGKLNCAGMEVRTCGMVMMIICPARALRALGLLLADGAPTMGGGKTF